MAESRVPITLRDYFLEDPFFKSTWTDFEKARESMLKESREMWERFEKDCVQWNAGVARRMRETYGTRSMLEPAKRDTYTQTEDTDRCTQTEDLYTAEGAGQLQRDARNGETHAYESVPDGSFVFPRRWMLPNLHSREWAKEFDLFQTKDSDVIRVKEDDSKLEVSLDTSQYRPDELRVNVGNGVISVEGKHEEKSQDGHKMVSRMFSRKYGLPDGAKAEDVVSNLSSDGVLVISAPKRPALQQDRTVPIALK